MGAPMSFSLKLVAGLVALAVLAAMPVLAQQQAVGHENDRMNANHNRDTDVKPDEVKKGEKDKDGAAATPDDAASDPCVGGQAVPAGAGSTGLGASKCAKVDYTKAADPSTFVNANGSGQTAPTQRDAVIEDTGTAQADPGVERNFSNFGGAADAAADVDLGGGLSRGLGSMMNGGGAGSGQAAAANRSTNQPAGGTGSARALSAQDNVRVNASTATVQGRGTIGVEDVIRGAAQALNFDPSIVGQLMGQSTAGLSATQMAAQNLYPDTKEGRAAFWLQLMRERGIPLEAQVALMTTLGIEVGGVDFDCMVKNPTSSAYGCGQYINSTWAQTSMELYGYVADRNSLSAQADILFYDTMKRYDQYVNGTLAGCSAGMNFTQCNYAYHYAGSMSSAAGSNVNVALGLINEHASQGLSYFSNASALLDGGNASSIFANLQTMMPSSMGGYGLGGGYGSGGVGSLVGYYTGGLSNGYGGYMYSGGGSAGLSGMFASLFGGSSSGGSSGSSSSGSKSSGGKSSSSLAAQRVQVEDLAAQVKELNKQLDEAKAKKDAAAE